MKTRSLALALTLLVGISAVACKDSPTDPDDELNYRFTAPLSPASEVPPVTNADASASGTMTGTLKTVKNAAGNVTSATMDFSVTFNNFPANTTITGAHIHTGSTVTNGGIVVNLAVAAGSVTLSGTGGATITRDAVVVTADTAQGMINGPSNFYFNVHTSLNTGGAIRGQLVKQ